MAGKALSFLNAPRDSDGRLVVETSERSLADLLPPANEPRPVSPPRSLPSRRVQVAVAVAALLVLTAAWALLPRSTRPTAARPTMLPTVPARMHDHPRSGHLLCPSR